MDETATWLLVLVLGISIYGWLPLAGTLLIVWAAVRLHQDRRH